jgi:hypothetical protein
MFNYYADIWGAEADFQTRNNNVKKCKLTKTAVAFRRVVSTPEQTEKKDIIISKVK